MTIPSTAWDAHRAEVPRATVIDWAAAAMAVAMLLLYSQGWISLIFGEEISGSEGSLVRALYFPAYLAGLALLLLNPGDFLRVVARQPFLVLLLGICAASYLWSIAPGETLRRFIALAFTTVSGLALAARYRWSSLVEIMAAAFALLTLASLAVAVALPELGVMRVEFPGAWRGLWPEKNALGGNMALFLPVFVAAGIFHPRRALLWWGMAALALGLILMSTSKTSLLAVMLGLAAITFIALVRRGPVVAIGASYLAVVSLFLIVVVAVFAADVVFAVLGKDATLTGRTEIWAAIMNRIQDRPWLGYGYSAVWDDKSGWGPFAWIAKEAGFAPKHAHNSWLEQWLGMGLIGLVAWVLFYLQTVTAALIAVFREKGAYLVFPFLLVDSLIMLTESVAVTYNDLRWVMFVCLAAKLAYSDRPTSR